MSQTLDAVLATTLALDYQPPVDPARCQWLVRDETPGSESGVVLVESLMRQRLLSISRVDGRWVVDPVDVDVDHEAIMATAPTDDQAHLARVVVHLASLRQQYGEASIALLPPSLYGPFERLGAVVLAWLYRVVVAPEGQAAGGLSWAYAPGLAEPDGAGGHRVPEATQVALGGDSVTAPIYPDDLDVAAGSSSPEQALGDAFVAHVASTLGISGAEAQRRINRTYAQMYGGRADGEGGHVFTRALPGGE